MGRIVSVINLKGGIGKTTTVINVGAGLALKGGRVLLVDMDAQGNLAPSLGVKPRRTISDMLLDNLAPEKCIIAARPNLDLIAADDSLLGAQPTISRRPDWSRVLEQVLKPLKPDYDFILVDSPGSLTVLSVNALSTSNDLLVPTTVEHLSLKGLELLFKQVQRLKNSTSSIRIIVPTMFDARLRQANTLLEELQATYGLLVAPPIRANVRLSEAISASQTIYEYDPRSRGAIDYARLVERLSQMWNFRPTARPQPAAPVGHPNGDHAPLIVARQAAPAAAVPMPRPAEVPAAPVAAAVGSAAPVVAGAGSLLQSQCPNCSHPLTRVTVAGYRVAFCEHCKYKQQELISGPRR